jgi:hypothetical protein
MAKVRIQRWLASSVRGEPESQVEWAGCACSKHCSLLVPHISGANWPQVHRATSLCLRPCFWKVGCSKGKPMPPDTVPPGGQLPMEGFVLARRTPPMCRLVYLRIVFQRHAEDFLNAETFPQSHLFFTALRSRSPEVCTRFPDLTLLTVPPTPVLGGFTYPPQALLFFNPPRHYQTTTHTHKDRCPACISVAPPKPTFQDLKRPY